MAQFRQPDFSRGDPNTLGGYIAVHDRPAAFEGSDGFSYTVEILTSDEGDAPERWGAYLFFVKWARIGSSAPEGHLESDFLARGASEDDARRKVGALPLNAVKRTLDELIARSPGGVPKRKWWDAMREENGAGSEEDPH
jgi:hypothetical protein